MTARQRAVTSVIRHGSAKTARILASATGPMTSDGTADP
jgi:hypothetical protein